jgi:hypothetical protein
MYLYFTMNKIKEISILVIFGLILFSINSITKRKTSEKQKTIISLPINTVQYTRIESIHLLKKFIYNELFVIKDQLVLEKLKSISKNQDENEFSGSNFNIDITAPIELININLDGENYSIIRMKSNKKGIEGVFSLPYFETESEKCFLIKGDKKNIKSLKNQFSKSFKYSLESKTDISIFNFINKNLVRSSIISVQKNRIKVITNEKQHLQKKQLILKESGFHFSFPIEDGIQMNEQLQQIPILPKINFPFKDIRHISGNYSGFKFTENDSIVGIPKIDLLISFKQKTKVDSLILNLMKQLNVEFPIRNNQVSFGKEKLYFSQITPKIIYLSTRNSTPKIEKSSHPIKIAGDLTKITELENAGWKGMLIEVIPVFKSTKNLLQTTKNVEFKKVNANSYEILIPMKENKNAYHELLKLALSSTF